MLLSSLFGSGLVGMLECCGDCWQGRNGLWLFCFCLVATFDLQSPVYITWYSVHTRMYSPTCHIYCSDTTVGPCTWPRHLETHYQLILAWFASMAPLLFTRRSFWKSLRANSFWGQLGQKSSDFPSDLKASLVTFLASKIHRITPTLVRGHVGFLRFPTGADINSL